MSNLDELLILLGLLAAAGFWMKQSRARERATCEARRQCRQYGVQLLDESVGLRRWRMRRVDGRVQLERGYGFEVSIDGSDRELGTLWMHDGVLAELHMPAVVLAPVATAAGPDAHATLPVHESPDTAAIEPTATASNVIPLRPRRQGDQSLH